MLNFFLNTLFSNKNTKHDKCHSLYIMRDVYLWYK